MMPQQSSTLLYLLTGHHNMPTPLTKVILTDRGTRLNWLSFLNDAPKLIEHESAQLATGGTTTNDEDDWPHLILQLWKKAPYAVMFFATLIMCFPTVVVYALSIQRAQVRLLIPNPHPVM